MTPLERSLLHDRYRAVWAAVYAQAWAGRALEDEPSSPTMIRLACAIADRAVEELHAHEHPVREVKNV